MEGFVLWIDLVAFVVRKLPAYQVVFNADPVFAFPFERRFVTDHLVFLDGEVLPGARRKLMFGQEVADAVAHGAGRDVRGQLLVAQSVERCHRRVPAERLGQEGNVALQHLRVSRLPLKRDLILLHECDCARDVCGAVELVGPLVEQLHVLLADDVVFVGVGHVVGHGCIGPRGRYTVEGFAELQSLHLLVLLQLDHSFPLSNRFVVSHFAAQPAELPDQCYWVLQVGILFS